MNAAYGYHVHAELVGREGTVALAPPALTMRNKDPHRRSFLSRQLGSALRGRLSQTIDRLDWCYGHRNSGRGERRGWLRCLRHRSRSRRLSAKRGTALKCAPRPPLYGWIN